MSDRLHDAVEVCLAALDSGADPQAVRSLYPELEHELTPVLEAALAAGLVATPPPSADTVRASRLTFLGRADQLRRRVRSSPLFGLPRMAFVAAGLLVLLITAGGLGLAAASAEALPGDGLYPVKRSLEAVTLRFTLDSARRGSLLGSYRERRVAETRNLIDRGLERQVAFEGVIREIGGSGWLVDDIRVIPAEGALVDPGLELGMAVEVLGQVRAGGWVEADQVRLRAYLLVGVTEAVEANSWLVSGVRLQITPLTLIDPRLRVGDDVIALVQVDDEGDREALALLLSEPGITSPSPRIEPGPVSTGTPDDVEETEEAEREDQASETPEPEQDRDEHAEDDDETEAPKQPTETEEDESEEDEEEKLEFVGTLQSKGSSSWTINGVQVQITAQTEIRDNPKVGDQVKVKAVRQAGGPWIAERIEIED